MVKISAIIPVYNSEKYLKRCIDSLLNQTLKEIEIILINDGSTDNSQVIIDDYAKKFPSIFKIFSQPNHGQASARNLGLKCATGEFISFIDSDDYLELTAYEEAYNFSISNNLDIVCFNFFEENNNIKKVSSYYKFNNYPNDIKYVLNETSPVNKIIRKSLISKNNIKFMENYIYEDLELIPKLVLYTNKIGFLNKCLYNYVIHENSTMRQLKYTQKLNSIYFVTDSLMKSFENTKYTKELEYIFIEHLLHGAALRYLQYPEGKEDIEKIANIMKNNFPSWDKNIYFKKQNIKYKIVCKLVYYKKINLLKKILKIRS